LNGEPWLFWGLFRSPELQSLQEIQSTINQLQSQPAEQVFRNQWRLVHLPTFVRRMLWWWNLKIETRKRASRLGTYFVSTLSGQGVEIQLPPSVQTGCLTYGPLDQHHISRVTLAYDHRIMDGTVVARVLNRLELVLNESLVAELKLMTQATPNHRAA
jgi:hypothetical protein